MILASTRVTFRDFLIFQAKLMLDGLRDVVVFNLSIGAMVLDVLAGRGRRPRLFYSVVRLSERWELWLNMHSVVEELESSDTDDGLFGASEAGSDTLLGQIEQAVRGGDREERGRRG